MLENAEWVKLSIQYHMQYNILHRLYLYTLYCSIYSIHFSIIYSSVSIEYNRLSATRPMLVHVLSWTMVRYFPIHLSALLYFSNTQFDFLKHFPSLHLDCNLPYVDPCFRQTWWLVAALLMIGDSVGIIFASGGSMQWQMNWLTLFHCLFISHNLGKHCKNMTVKIRCLNK